MEGSHLVCWQHTDFVKISFCIPEFLPDAADKKVSAAANRKKLTHLIKNAEVYTGSVIFVKTLLNNRPVYDILVKNSLALDRGEV